MNPLYNMLMSGISNSGQPVNPQALTPAQKMQYVSQAMQNAPAFVKQAFPDIPFQIQNNPAEILQYLQRTRNISNNQIQQIYNQLPMKG